MKNYLMKVLIFVSFIMICLVVGVYVHAKDNNDMSVAFYKAKQAFNEKVSKKDYVDVKALKNVNGKKQYVLVEGEDAYLIYDTTLDDFIEFSSTCNSPYYFVNDKFEIVYFPVGNYFYIDNDIYYSLVDNFMLKNTEISLLKEEMETVEKQIINNKKIFKDGSKGQTDVGSVAYPYFFENLINNMGTSNQYQYYGSCGYVAMEMVLSYYDSVITDNVIAESYDVTSSKSFTSYTAIQTSSYTQSPGINDNFHSYLINMGRTQGYTQSTSYEIANADIAPLFTYYFTSRNITSSAYYTSTNTNKVQFCKSAISSGYPVIIHIIGIDTSIYPVSLSHDVVGYKYDSSGIYVNLGWKSTQTSVCISNYTIDSAVYASISATHSHSNNYLWTCSGCSGTICPCGNKTCNHGSYHYNQFNALRHKKVCDACGHQQNENHHFQNVGGDQVCSDCGYTEANHTHSYLYSWKSYTQHRATCLCGDMHDEIHVVPANAFQNGEQYATCLLCGGQATIGIVYQNIFDDGLFISIGKSSVFTELQKNMNCE